MKILRTRLLSIPGIRNVRDDEQCPSNRLIILDEGVKDVGEAATNSPPGCRRRAVSVSLAELGSWIRSDCAGRVCNRGLCSRLAGSRLRDTAGVPALHGGAGPAGGQPSPAAFRLRVGALQCARVNGCAAPQEILPAGMDPPSSFETVGHVAHLNLRDELLPHKQLVGQVLLEKNGPVIRTIVNKACLVTRPPQRCPLQCLFGR